MTLSDRKIFGTLFFSVFTVVTGIGIVVPLLPIYAHDLGASGFYISMIFGIFSLSRTFLLPYFGRASDKNGRKHFIVAGLMGHAVVSAAFIYTTDVNTLLIIRFFQGATSAMVMPVVQAYIGDITPEGKEGFFMGIINLSMFLGLSLGPLAGGLISDSFSLDAAFACMGILSIISALFSLFFLPPVKSERIVMKKKEPETYGRLLRDKVIAGIVFTRFAYVSSIGIIWCFLPVFADAEFELSSPAIGILVMLAIFISGILQLPMGWLADRINKNYMIIGGFLLVAYASCSFAWADGFYDILMADILFGIGGGIAMPPLMAISVIKGQETGSMGSVMGLLTTGHSMGMLIGPIIAGITMDFFELHYAFPMGSVVMMAGVLVFVYCMYEKDKSSELKA